MLHGENGFWSRAYCSGGGRLTTRPRRQSRSGEKRWLTLHPQRAGMISIQTNQYCYCFSCSTERLCDTRSQTPEHINISSTVQPLMLYAANAGRRCSCRDAARRLWGLSCDWAASRTQSKTINRRWWTRMYCFGDNLVKTLEKQTAIESFRNHRDHTELILKQKLHWSRHYHRLSSSVCCSKVWMQRQTPWGLRPVPSQYVLHYVPSRLCQWGRKRLRHPSVATSLPSPSSRGTVLLALVLEPLKTERKGLVFKDIWEKARRNLHGHLWEGEKESW